MVQYRNANDPTNESRPETLTPHRPPQFKVENCGCGYRCGWGCEEPLQESLEDSGDGETETEATCVGSFSENSMSESHEDDFDDGEEAHWQGTLAVAGEYEESVSHIDSSQREGASHQPLSPHGYDDIAGSLEPEPYIAEDHSRMTSKVGSVGSASPLPGFEYETLGLPPVQFPPQYLFLDPPLWLSPQLEHCRGI